MACIRGKHIFEDVSTHAVLGAAAIESSRSGPLLVCSLISGSKPELVDILPSLWDVLPVSEDAESLMLGLMKYC